MIHSKSTLTLRKRRERRLNRIITARFIIWMHSKKIEDYKERMRHMRAVYYLCRLAAKAPL